MSGKGIVTLILSLLLVLFILQNTGMVSIKFLFWSLLMSRSILVFWFFFMGFILGYILFAARKKKGE
ncbi:MAG: LapA family protein [candidate division Zixibacteria bacterium]|nr:LapA family protein [candidate division Zixibacteria bacterium]